MKTPATSANPSDLRTYRAALLVLAFGLAAECRGEGRTPPAQKEELAEKKSSAPVSWREHLSSCLGKPISLRFEGTSLQDAILFLGNISGATLVLDSDAGLGEKKLTMHLQDVKVQEALDQVCKRAGIAYRLEEGAVFLSTNGRIEGGPLPPVVAFKEDSEEPGADKAPLKNCHGQTVRDPFKGRLSFDFVNTPLADVLSFLSCITPIHFVVDDLQDIRKRPATLRVSKMRLDHALGWICRAAHVKYGITKELILVTTPERIARWRKRLKEGPYRGPENMPDKLRANMEKRISFDFMETPLTDVAASLSDLTGVKIQFAPEVEAKKLLVTLKASEIRIGSALAWVARLHDLKFDPVDQETILIHRE